MIDEEDLRRLGVSIDEQTDRVRAVGAQVEARLRSAARHMEPNTRQGRLRHYVTLVVAAMALFLALLANVRVDANQVRAVNDTNAPAGFADAVREGG